MEIALPESAQGATNGATNLDESKSWRGRAIHNKRISLEPHDAMVLLPNRRN